VRRDDLIQAARRWAEQIVECAPLSVRASKECAMEGLRFGSLETAMRERYPAMGRMLESDDLVEGPRSFAEKRPPRWTGR